MFTRMEFLANFVYVKAIIRFILLMERKGIKCYQSTVGSKKCLLIRIKGKVSLMTMTTI